MWVELTKTSELTPRRVDQKENRVLARLALLFTMLYKWHILVYSCLYSRVTECGGIAGGTRTEVNNLQLRSSSSGIAGLS